MPFVTYVVPYFTPNAVRFMESLVSFHDLRLAIISQEPVNKLPGWQLSRISIARQVGDVMNTESLISTLTDIMSCTGLKPDRFLGATEQLQVPLAAVRAHFGGEGMDVETARKFRDKSLMKQIFDREGIPCARHAMVTDATAAYQFREVCPYPYVVKPVAGAGSQTTFRVSHDEDMRYAFEQIGQAANQGVIIEEFVKGDEYSLDTFSLNGDIIGQTINRYYPTPLEVMMDPTIQWRVILDRQTSGPEFNDIRHAGKQALDALGMHTGMSHMEWFRRPDGSIAISEVAARPPGAQFTTLISRSCDFDAVRSWVQLMVYGKAEIPSMQYTSGAAYLRAPRQGHISHVEGIETIRSRYKDIITDIRIPQKGQLTSTSYEGEGFVIVRHPDTQVVDLALQDITEHVKVRLL